MLLEFVLEEHSDLALTPALFRRTRRVVERDDQRKGQLSFVHQLGRLIRRGGAGRR
jgi:hypothetical protein